MDTLIIVSNVANVLGSLSLVITALLLIRELRENNKLIRAANAQALVEISGPYYMAMAQDRQLAELFHRSAVDFDSMDDVDRRRFRSLLIWWLIFYENVFYQRRQRLLDRHAFKPWQRDLKQFIREQNVGQHWGGLKELFQDEFATLVTALIEGRETTTSTAFSEGDD
jgi:hypothetical protein